MTGHRTILQPRVLARVLELRRRCETSTGRRILKNIAALSIAQGASCLLPLVILPYTAMVLGPQKFGVVALTQAAVQYSTLITNYGFSYSATRQAAVSQGDPHKLAEIVVHVWVVKSFLMAVCLIVSVGVFAITPSLRPALCAYFCGFLTVIGNVLYLDWFFQAIEEMKWITLINVIPKLILTPLIFLLVRGPSDYALLILIQSATILTSGAAGAFLARRRLSVPLPTPTFAGALAQLKDGWRTFLSAISVNVYTSTNTILLGMMTNTTIVGYYSAGQKVVGAVQSLWTPTSQAIYPHFCKLFHGEPQRAAKDLRRLLGLVFGLTLAGSSLLSIATPYVVPVYLGVNFTNSVRVIQALIFSFCAVSTNVVLGLHCMLASGLHSAFLRVVTSAAVANLLLAPLAIRSCGPVGLAVSTVLIEASIALHEYWILRRNAVL